MITLSLQPWYINEKCFHICHGSIHNYYPGNALVFMIKVVVTIVRNASDVIVRATRIRKSAESGLPLDLVGIKLGEGAYNEIFMVSSVCSLRDL